MAPVFSPPARTWFVGVAALSVLLVGRCAHQVAPGGGPLDKTPPTLLQTDPPSGSVGVPTDTDILIQFSEWIAPRAVAKSVAMFPPPPGGYEVVAKGRSLTIHPKAGLADSTTYHVELTDALQDLRGNKLGRPQPLVFATGAVLDSGRVKGCVIDPSRRVLRPRVALFRVDTAWNDTNLFGAPSYLTQTDSGGRFSLAHVRPGRYELLAFTDANDDNRLQPGREQAYAAQHRAYDVDSTSRDLLLFPVASDTAARRLTACTAVSNRVVMGSWSRGPLRDGRHAPLPPLRIVSADSLHHQPGIERVVVLADGRSFALVLADSLHVGLYRLYYDIQPLLTPPDTVSLQDSVSFNSVAFADTLPPKLLSSGTRTRSELRPRIRLAWSEPVRFVGEAVLLGDSLGDTVHLAVDTGYTDTLTLEPRRRLLPGRSYRARLPRAAVVDLGGLHPVDSADTGALVLSVATIAADSLAVSLSGGAACLGPSAIRRWQFSPVGASRVYTVADGEGNFRFDSIPGARGFLSYYEDRDGDGRHRFGELTPWVAPELSVSFYDTVEARARWDITGVRVPACEPCHRDREAPLQAEREQ